MTTKILTYFFLFTGILVLSGCGPEQMDSTRQQINLDGEWLFAMDSADVGIQERWFANKLSDVVNLPGTMDENDKGFINTNRNETMRLSREKTYEGKAWYQKNIIVGEEWQEKEIFLILERTKVTSLWVDNVFIGSDHTILSPQNYKLTDILTPGEHILTILVDNGSSSVPRGIQGSHSWTEHTQTNWNGIIGDIYLEASEKRHISSIRVTPDLKTMSAIVKIKIENNDEPEINANLIVQASLINSTEKHIVRSEKIKMDLKKGKNSATINYPMGEKARLWSEFSPALYRLSVKLETSDGSDVQEVDFGMREFKTEGTQFTINGLTTFLRGEHNACVFPKTAYPPMEEGEWIRIFKIAQSYGINHYRYHSWTPPKAAFIAADKLGIYMQPELPLWGRLRKKDRSGLNEFLIHEGERILETYGNYASFCMFALGNELSGDLEVMQDMVNHFRSLDPRPLYAFGSNNYLGTRGQSEGEDFFVTCRVGGDTDATYSTHTRASFSFADAYDGGYINGRYPSTSLDYSGAISKCSVPVVGHEIAQYQIYPNYDEMKKYTGVLKPWNFEIFRQRIIDSGMEDQALDFFKASGAASMLCYRADVEMAIRTPGFGGFQLLDLQDFPGQGSALVGILDAFMDSKGLITPNEFSMFCNDVVPLIILEKYCWNNTETFTAEIKVANYSESTLSEQAVNWELTNKNSVVLASGQETNDLKQGDVANAGSIEIPLNIIDSPQKLMLSINLEGTNYKNNYPVWIYPENKTINTPEEIVVADELDVTTLNELNSGAKILLFPNQNDLLGLTVGGLFTPDYWNYKMFKGISENNNKPVSPGTMGILTNPYSPLFKTFPTEFHSNWQWWPIVKKSTPFILDNAPEGYKPLVQVVDNIERNHKLGLIFEFAVGNGKLLVCMSDLQSIQDKPEARQLYQSILTYMSSKDFNPETELTVIELKNLFSNKIATRQIKTIGNISYE
ncbi:MAG: beta-glycosidase [Mariniphaga sp.]|nr:beta-glycosidase [Mariniphaga sp.]